MGAAAELRDLGRPGQGVSWPSKIRRRGQKLHMALVKINVSCYICYIIKLNLTSTPCGKIVPTRLAEPRGPPCQ